MGVLRYGPGEGAVEHSHPQEQMMYVLQGRLLVQIEGTTHELLPGDLCHMPPGVPHRVTALDEEVIVLSCKNVIGGQGHRI
ncbi:cupin domain-containing protein [Thermaerobacter composti]|uniref:cupin domain-containing protein n=1 Tax=Thermaerobacter composti TaxID=554949 RepID=UPI00399FA813